MTRISTPALLAALSLSLSVACGDDGNVQPDATVTVPDATPSVDADLTTCVGRPDGSPCGDQSETECDGPDYCLSGFCFANYQSAGRACGDETDTACDGRDTCDGFGACLANLAAAGFPCGDATDDECTAPDTCDGEGVCLNNHVPDGASCGAADDTTCTSPDTCLEGACVSNNAPEVSSCDDCPLGAGQCAGCITGECLNVCGGPYGLLTETSGTVRYDGFMLDIHAIETVRIESFEAVFPLGLHEVEIYYLPHAYDGFESMSFAWTSLGTSFVLYNDEPLPTAIPIPIDVVIPAGETYAFYITTKGTDMYSTSGPSGSESTVYTSDSSIEILVGVAKTYPFGFTYSPRIWNGRVNYVTNPPCAVTP